MNESKSTNRIGNVTAAFMVVVAIFADLISLIPVVGTIIALVFGGGTLALWFLMKGVGLVSPKKMAVWGLNLLAEVIPGVGTVWVGYTVGTIMMLAIVRVEDKTGIKLPSPSVGKKTPGSRSPRQKFRRRMEMSPEKRSELARRHRNIRRIRRQREQIQGVRTQGAPVFQE